jgi:hypothetical protein
MDMSVQKRFVSGPLAVLAVGLGVIGCMLFADASVAAVPPAGINCVASDGKVNGRGATFQERAQQTVFAPAYRDDFCGNTPKEPEDAAGNMMVAYNYAAAKEGSGTGSGAGLKAASCRTDAFSGTDIPYTEQNLKELNEAPGKTGGCAITFTPPFQPNSPAKWPDEEAGKVDSTANIMSFPAAGSDVSPVLNLTEKNCGVKPPTHGSSEVTSRHGTTPNWWRPTRGSKNAPVLSPASSVRTARERRTSSSSS